MKIIRFLPFVFLIVLILSVVALVNTFAAPGDSYSIAKYTMEGGVYTWNGGNGYDLCGTVGQHEDGFHSGAGYELGGGMYPGGRDTHILYLPIVDR